MVCFPLSRSLTLGRLYIVIPKASTIRLRNPSDPIGCPLKVTELLTWYTYFIPNDILLNSLLPLFKKLIKKHQDLI